MQKAVIDENTSGNVQMNKMFMILKKKLTPVVILTLPRGYIQYMYMAIIVEQIYLYGIKSLTVQEQMKLSAFGFRLLQSQFVFTGKNWKK